MTEVYTDMYMARNFRLINAHLDPDSIVFLGDLLDGGREWATSRARPLNRAQKDGGAEKSTEKRGEAADSAAVAGHGNADAGDVKVKRSVGSYRKALSMPHDHQIKKKDHLLDASGNDLKEFVPGENGRWSKWDQRQWDADFVRFGRIFFDTDQLYPQSDRKAFAAYEVPSDAISIENGASNATSQEYALMGGKQRRVITSLPGNHDVGFGMGVQLAVRDRFQLHFGESNRVDIIGNHTFVSLDTPSLSAAGQFLPEGGETSPQKIYEHEHVWKPTMDFLENLRAPARKAVADTLHEYYPDSNPERGYPHTVHDPQDLADQPTITGLGNEALKAKAQLPVIVLTHMPLYRDPDTDCGHLRERGRAISVSAGYQYQNVVTRSLSNTILNRVSTAGELAHIFSGDDHDYCDITHRYNLGQSNGGKSAPTPRSVKEITAKSFSWAMGVRHPGFQLVSLWNPVDATGKTVGTPLPTIQTHLCLLPDQLSIFIDYAILLGVTLVVLLVRAIFVGLRANAETDSDEGTWTPMKLVLPRFQPKVHDPANGSSTPTRNGSKSKGRQRTSSTSTSNNHGSNNSLGVQRSYNARTRSVSPANNYAPASPYAPSGTGLPNLQEHTGPLIEKAGYYPQVRWTDPDDESDEEKSVGVGGDGAEDEDSQAKWKKKLRTTGRVRRVLEEFAVSVLLVGTPVVLFYAWLIKNG
ncbi:hypothetical protein LTR36_002956 [Oleoguttula mirabilis]|uniref:Calcineurin-like phosphoesterase domain-containing protein n=1 Tax=Oleoguttula mirabilis TaxID=1507867 RepID=A0AAV9JWG9_9PEZI|nr:hypothetical protein LTR36_002956 [Oleoguttula mirabilis]